jgi:hypothetical protein
LQNVGTFGLFSAAVTSYFSCCSDSSCSNVCPRVLPSQSTTSPPVVSTSTSLTNVSVTEPPSTTILPSPPFFTNVTVTEPPSTTATNLTVDDAVAAPSSPAADSSMAAILVGAAFGSLLVIFGLVFVIVRRTNCLRKALRCFDNIRLGRKPVQEMAGIPDSDTARLQC